MTWEQLEAKTIKNTMKILFDVSSSFKSDVSIAPVVSGDLKRDWSHTRLDNGFAVTNNMIYAPKIWVGKPNADTWQVPNGLSPIYRKYQKILVQKMKGIDL